MHPTNSSSGRVRIKSRRKNRDASPIRRFFWNTGISGTQRTALAGFLAGVALGCLFGAILTLAPGGQKPREPTLSVNQDTDKSQLHIKGKPEIK